MWPWRVRGSLNGEGRLTQTAGVGMDGALERVNGVTARRSSEPGLVTKWLSVRALETDDPEPGNLNGNGPGETLTFVASSLGEDRAGDMTLAHGSDKFTVAGGDTHVENENSLVIGHSSQYAHDALSLGEFQMLGLGALDSEMVLGTWSNDSNGFTLGFKKSRDTASGATTLLRMAMQS